MSYYVFAVFVFNKDATASQHKNIIFEKLINKCRQKYLFLKIEDDPTDKFVVSVVDNYHFKLDQSKILFLTPSLEETTSDGFYLCGSEGNYINNELYDFSGIVKDFMSNTDYSFEEIHFFVMDAYSLPFELKLEITSIDELDLKWKQAVARWLSESFTHLILKI